MAMEKSQPPKNKVLMFPWLAHGHIFPFLELAKRLSTRNFTIYICSTSINLDSIKPCISENESSSVKLVELHMPSSPDLPAHLHTIKNLPSNLLPTLLKAFQMCKSSFSETLSSTKPDLLIYDFFQPWAPKLASSKGIPCVFFATSGATSFSFYHHRHTYGTGSTFPYRVIHQPDQEVANLRESIGPHIKDADLGDFAFGNFIMSTDIVLVSSCRAVEQKYIDYLSLRCKKHIVPMGPLIANASNYENGECFSDIMKWLSGKKEGSTLYVSFGSECFLPKDQIAEIAKALQLCGANFLWAIRFSGDETKTRRIEEELPEWFLEMVKERGKIVTGWAPQVKILAHSCVGGFVSHCGRSSITESMYFGVPIIAMPMKSGQPLNARLVVDVGVGVKVEKDKIGDYLGERTAKVISKVIGCEDMRSRAKDLSLKMRENEEQEEGEVAEELFKICAKNAYCL